MPRKIQKLKQGNKILETLSGCWFFSPLHVIQNVKYFKKIELLFLSSKQKKTDKGTLFFELQIRNRVKNSGTPEGWEFFPTMLWTAVDWNPFFIGTLNNATKKKKMLITIYREIKKSYIFKVSHFKANLKKKIPHLFSYFHVDVCKTLGQNVAVEHNQELSSLSPE